MKNNIKCIRKEAGLTQKECSEKLGVTVRAWQSYEQGISEPKNELLCRIADMFNVSVDAVLGHSVKENTDKAKLNKIKAYIASINDILGEE